MMRKLMHNSLAAAGFAALLLVGACAHTDTATTTDDTVHVTNDASNVPASGPANVDSDGNIYSSSAAPGTGNASATGTNTNVNIVPSQSSVAVTNDTSMTSSSSLDTTTVDNTATLETTVPETSTTVTTTHTETTTVPMTSSSTVDDTQTHHDDHRDADAHAEGLTRSVILSREDDEGSRNARMSHSEILRFRSDDGS